MRAFTYNRVHTSVARYHCCCNIFIFNLSKTRGYKYYYLIILLNQCYTFYGNAFTLAPIYSTYVCVYVSLALHFVNGNSSPYLLLKYFWQLFAILPTDWDKIIQCYWISQSLGHEWNRGEGGCGYVWCLESGHILWKMRCRYIIFNFSYQQICQVFAETLVWKADRCKVIENVKIWKFFYSNEVIYKQQMALLLKFLKQNV